MVYLDRIANKQAFSSGFSKTSSWDMADQYKDAKVRYIVDRKFYEGSLYKQIDDAYDFVLRMIRMGVVIKGTVRQVYTSFRCVPSERPLRMPYAIAPICNLHMFRLLSTTTGWKSLLPA